MAVDGYRLRVRDIRDLSQVMEGFRADALRILARSYGRLVAHEAVRLADLHAIGIPDPSSTTAGPLADANEAMRKAYLEAAGNGEFDLNCEVVIYLVGDAVLARFLSGNASYRKAWEARREVVRWGWSRSVERPKGLSEHNWKIREICWRNALAKSGLGSGLRFILLEGAPPELGWGGVRRYLPTIDERIRALASAVQPGASPREASRDAMLAIGRDLAGRLPHEITREMLASYSACRRPQRRFKRMQEPQEERKAQIDHADVVQSSDGRVFIAVPFVGLSTDDRVFIHVGDNHVAVVQNATQYGHVGNVPRAAVDLLRTCNTVFLVEVERRDGRRLLRARHIAIVRDISLQESVFRSLGRWRMAGAGRERHDGEIRQWESGQSTTSE